MTPQANDLRSVLALLERATPGEWHMYGGTNHGRVQTDDVFVCDGSPPHFMQPEDAEAIAAAVNFLRTHADRLTALLHGGGGEAVGEYSWQEGEPPKWLGEWFIAQLDTGERVVLRRLPEEWTYDYKTADETYYAARRLKRWMQFPDSQYAPIATTPPPQPRAPEDAVDRAIEAWDEVFDGDNKRAALAHVLATAQSRAEPVAWSRDDLIRNDDGYAIGTDETEVHWGSESPGEGWHPLYDGPPPRGDMVLVPREPTPEMIAAQAGPIPTRRDVWTAMLAAAPGEGSGEGENA